MTDRRLGTRRALLAAAPALAAGAVASAASAEDLPAPGLEFALEVLAALGPAETPGATPYGKRNRVPITGGRFEGPRIKGTVLEGADWQLIRGDGATILEAEYMLKAEDGALIHVLNRGVAVPGQPFYLRSSPVFEAPTGPHDWLNKAVFVATIGQAPDAGLGRAVRIRCYKVL
jgi:hypothetical protein